MASTSINLNRTMMAKVPNQNDIKKNDEIEVEYNYYVTLVRQMLLPMSDDERTKIAKWIHFLVNPLNSAQPLELREKRNQYLFIICCGLLTGNINSFLKIARAKHLKVDKMKKSKNVKVAGTQIGVNAPPQKSVIADEHGFPQSLAVAINPLKLTTIDDVFERAEWQHCRFWEIRLQNAKEAEAALIKSSKSRVQSTKKGNDKNDCVVHGPNAECPQDLVNSKVGKCLDKQFEYLLALAESYKDLLRHDESKLNRVNLWLQKLSKIDSSKCVYMKGIRNDYIMVLIGYLVHAELKGPFEDLPAANLQPLTEAVATYIKKRKNESNDKSKVPLNPAGDTIEAFMNGMPTIEEGAFALLSLSGNVFSMKPTRQ
ncbi:hypothetical protein PVAND_007598 [Polypedilum vanderplanki]|uniref:DUF4485 domain-containing protein n=1 Tax=Polypedilum vanderplanki TaxID=319348 RepID=A0A9J6C722_POLVA|nr:hypothetical protein PVAND_007598 [Polypedilum vanderplanki]